ncbi:MAG TPA: M1 family metallopeptidase [Longimicrobiales bacterium]|nr:M1 family metallopeptidase [Longimicrobiales bacterium]
MRQESVLSVATAATLLLLAVAPPVSAGTGPARRDTYPKNPDIDMLHYAFDLTLSDRTDVIRGVARIDARYLRAGHTGLRLDLVQRSDALDGRGMTVELVRMGEEELTFRHEGDQLFIDLPRSPAAGGRVQVEVVYHGTPATGLQIGRTKYGDRSFFSDNWPDRGRHWLPMVDHPYDKATSEMRITAPQRYQVISNGLVVEETDLGDGNRVTHWRQSVPIATWLYVLGVAEFAVQHVDDFDGKSIQTWVFRQDRDAGFHDFAVPTKQALAFYSDRIGPFSYEKLANVQSNSVAGGMEAASAILYSANSVTGDRDRRWQLVIVHEIAHQWFGNAVTESDWDDVWLSEGFATYFTLLFREYASGRDDFVRGLLDARDRVFDFYAERGDYRVVHDNLDDMSQVTTGMQYQKGAWVLHMLRELVGDDAFWAGVRAYYAHFRDGNATTADFRRFMQEASGRDLEWFFRQWLYQGGNVELEGSWSPAPAGVRVRLRQIQDRYRFRFPVDVAVELAGGSVERRTVWLSESGAFDEVLAVDGEVTGVTLDPDTRLLARWTMGREP